MGAVSATLDLRVRFAVDDEVLSDLHGRAFGTRRPVTQPWTERLERHSLSWVGAFDGETLVGFVHACWDGGAHAFLLDTVVHPAYQRRGIGRRLVQALVAEVTAAGCQWLHVDHEPHLDGFYRDCGFRPTAAGLISLGSTSGR
jgi:GNAT superfamily N-acetyltransferase